jgi:hypothetical protein
VGQPVGPVLDDLAAGSGADPWCRGSWCGFGRVGGGHAGAIVSPTNRPRGTAFGFASPGRLRRVVAAIELYFEPVVERRIRTLWTAMEQAGVPSLANHTHRRHRPHVSLVVADELPPEPVAAALGALALPIPVMFQYVGQFPGGVLWLGPAPTVDLLALHRATVDRLDAAGIPFWPSYRPDVWVPHCTLSMSARGEAVARAVRLCFDILPVPASLVSAAVVDHARGLMRPLPVSSSPAHRPPVAPGPPESLADSAAPSSAELG